MTVGVLIMGITTRPLLAHSAVHSRRPMGPPAWIGATFGKAVDLSPQGGAMFDLCTGLTGKRFGPSRAGRSESRAQAGRGAAVASSFRVRYAQNVGEGVA